MDQNKQLTWQEVMQDYRKMLNEKCTMDCFCHSKAVSDNLYSNDPWHAVHAHQIPVVSPQISWVAHHESISSIQFIPSSACILTASLDGTARLWTLDASSLGGISPNQEVGYPQIIKFLDKKTREDMEKQIALDLLKESLDG